MRGKLTRGVVHGRTFVPTENFGLVEGQEIDLPVEGVPARKAWGEGLLQSAHALADVPTRFNPQHA